MNVETHRVTFFFEWMYLFHFPLEKIMTISVYLQIVGCLINLINKKGYENEDDGSILLACDTILNVLLKVVLL